MSKKTKDNRKGEKRESLRRSKSEWKDRYQDEATSLAILSYEYEWKRYESLLNASGRMIAGLSLVVVALVTVMPLLLGAIELIRRLVIVELVVAILVLSASLFMAVLMQFRYKYNGVKSPTEISAWLVERFEELEEDGDKGSHSRGLTVGAISDPHSTLSSLNDKLAKFMDASVVLLLVAVGLIIASIAVDCAVFFAPLVR